jgi:hypothetical protein
VGTNRPLWTEVWPDVLRVAARTSTVNAEPAASLAGKGFSVAPTVPTSEGRMCEGIVGRLDLVMYPVREEVGSLGNLWTGPRTGWGSYVGRC